MIVGSRDGGVEGGGRGVIYIPIVCQVPVFVSESLRLTRNTDDSVEKDRAGNPTASCLPSRGKQRKHCEAPI